MAKVSSDFVCQQCGYVSPQYLGKCPNCGEWNTFVETVVSTKIPKSKFQIPSQKPIKLSDVKAAQTTRINTGISELDMVLGGGIVPGMAVLLSGEPGIGKSTLLLELASKTKGAVLYVAGEESASQIKIRASRLGIKADNLLILETTDVDAACAVIDQRVGLVIVDSVQTLSTTDLSGTAGSVGQVRESAARLIATTKPLNIPLFLVGHVTKEGTIAGPKVLEHAVDTILNLEGEKYTQLRLLRTTKNRFGPTDEVGIFQMTDSGMEPTKDFHGLVVDEHRSSEPGSCLTITMEGTRPMLAEIQALVTSTPLPMPRRVASGINYNRLQTIIAILQKRLSVPLYKEDVYVSVAGGLKIEEPAIDLAVALAIMSSYKNKAITANTVAIGELDLLGNVRRVNSLERRIKEAKKLGFNKIISAETLASLAAWAK
ncbi:DNA repair protein RadA [Patescibacteria group bacterium]|nr:DNA repair protein RadA [Patescibacteria group bacterium]